MNQFKDYIEKIRSAKTLKDFTIKKDFNYTVAFIIPDITSAEGVYRTMLPCYYLNKMTTIRAIPVGLAKMDEVLNSISVNQKDYTIKTALVESVDHIVFPFVSYPIKGVIEKAKKINKKIKFSYYIDFNYYLIPDSYPFAKEYTGAEIIASIESNIIAVDQVIVTNKPLYNYLSLELAQKEHIKGCRTNICYQPTYYDKSLFPSVPERTDKKTKTRFGLVMNQSHFSDLNFIKGILKEFMKNNSDNAEIVLLGWNGMYKDKNYLSSIDVEYHAPVKFFDYFQTLIDLKIDCFIIPAKDNKFNATSKNTVKFFEFTRLGVPVIAPDIEPYRALIKHNDNAVLCNSKESWLFEMETFLKDPTKLQGLQDRAYNSIIDMEITDSENLKLLMNIYEVID